MHIKYGKQKLKRVCLTWESMIIVCMHQAQFYFNCDFHQVNVWLQKFTIKSEEACWGNKVVFSPQKVYSLFFVLIEPVAV